MLRVLSGTAVRRLLPMEDAVKVNAEAFMQHHRGTIVNPARVSVDVPDEGPTLFMPCYMPQSTALGLKVVSVRAQNFARGLPGVPSVVLLFNDATGMPLALLDGTYLTALRTAAGSAAATRLLAAADATQLVVFGAGNQARLHVEAMLAVRPSLTCVTIVNRNVDRARALTDELERTVSVGTPLRWQCLSLSDSPAVQAAVATADIVCTCTDSREALFPGAWLRRGAHINAIGAYTPAMRELDTACVQRCVTFMDTDKALTAGDLHGPLQLGDIAAHTHVRGTLGALLCGDVDAAPATADQDVTLFKSCGVAFQDIATAWAVLQRSATHGEGVEVDLT